MGNDTFSTSVSERLSSTSTSMPIKPTRKRLLKMMSLSVWACKTLQNNKALVSTTVPDGMYYEVTYDGDKQQAYVDVYKKWQNYSVIV